jgi:import inner membrane translocase subunit TIM50
MLEMPGQPPKKTLVLNLNKTIIFSEYKMHTGFNIFKRPELMRFLKALGNDYEIVVFGTEDGTYVTEVCQNLDKFNMTIQHKLGKEAAALGSSGRYIKDLNYLNRDLKRVIVVDYDPENVKYHPDNTIIIPEYKGDVNDKELFYLIVLLKELAKPDVKDVREVISKYGSYKTYLNFYKSHPKYNRYLPKENPIPDDADLQAVYNKKENLKK